MSRVLIVTPAAPGSLRGNRITAERYLRLLEDDGHEISIVEQYGDEDCDVMIALHARRSAGSIRALRAARPDVPIILVMTGTDLYTDVPAGDADALASIAAATRIVVLHARGAADLPAEVRQRVRVVVQSVDPIDPVVPPPSGRFRVCVLGHLRACKDPFRTLEAAKGLDASSRIEIVHIGDALEPELGDRALHEDEDDPRYCWQSELPHAEALQLLASSHLHVLSSELEGGANALCEAIACGVPSVSTRIPGSVGILGAEYPGYFPVGDTEALTRLLTRCEQDEEFLASLRSWTRELRRMVEPAGEREALGRVVCEVLEHDDSRIHILDMSAETDEATARSEFAADIREGLGATRKSLPCRYIYDARGSELFEKITAMPEYYPTQTEISILKDHARDLPPRFGPQPVILELGSGSSEKATVLLGAFEDAGHAPTYMPLDISRAALEGAADELTEAFPHLRVTAIHGDYSRGPEWLASHPMRERLIVYLGSNLGNFERGDALDFAREIRTGMNPRDALLIGLDLRKDPETLLDAYDDPAGITATFNSNLLRRINDEFGGTFDLDAFDYTATYDEGTGRVGMFLVSKKAQSVRIEDLDMTVEFAADEAIHTESSIKYSLVEIDQLAREAGFRVAERWLDDARRFSLNLLVPAV